MPVAARVFDSRVGEPPPPPCAIASAASSSCFRVRPDRSTPSRSSSALSSGTVGIFFLRWSRVCVYRVGHRRATSRSGKICERPCDLETASGLSKLVWVSVGPRKPSGLGGRRRAAVTIDCWNFFYLAGSKFSETLGKIKRCVCARAKTWRQRPSTIRCRYHDRVAMCQPQATKIAIASAKATPRGTRSNDAPRFAAACSAVECGPHKITRTWLLPPPPVGPLR